MQYRRLGRSNLEVSRLCLGTMMFADQTDIGEARNIVASAREHGINFIDTADIYSKGACENMVGELIRDTRDDWVLATKLGNRMKNEPNRWGYSRKWIRHEVQASLKRLGTDHIDILYMHRDFPGTNLEDAVRAFDDLLRDGTIGAIGLSNFRGWRIAEFVHLCRQANVAPPVVCQPYYNLMNRGPEQEILPACDHYGMGVVPYSPVARGVLTGKYQPGAAPPAGTRAARGEKRIMEVEFREESLQIAQQLREHCDGRGIKLSHFATAWVLANKFVTSVIVGPRTLAQMEDYYPALDVQISAEEEAMVNGMVSPGHPSTPGYNDPNDPLIGR